MTGDSSTYAPLGWPSSLVADQQMAYESLDLLYKVKSPDSFGERIGLILSCSSRHSSSEKKNLKSFLHKVEVTTLPNFSQARIVVTHEVQPGLDSCSQIIPINDTLKVASFDSGSIIPIKNFGYKKTFNSEVSSRLTHHTGPICSMAANQDGNRLATGCSEGIVTLYQVREEEISFLFKASDKTNVPVSAMTFLKTGADLCHGSGDRETGGGECSLVYSTNIGEVNLLDSRCDPAQPLKERSMFDLEPRFGITSLLHSRSSSGSMIYIGGCEGQMFACDFRMNGRPVHELMAKSGQTIRRMKEIVIEDGPSNRTFLAFSNSTNEIEILDSETMKHCDGWTCDRQPEGRVTDLIQVDDKIVTCGENVSIGCWHWNRQQNDD